MGGKGSSSLLLWPMYREEPCCRRAFFDLMSWRCVNGSGLAFDELLNASKWLFGDKSDIGAAAFG